MLLCQPLAFVGGAAPIVESGDKHWVSELEVMTCQDDISIRLLLVLGTSLIAAHLLPAHAQVPPLPPSDPTLKQLERPGKPPPKYQPPPEEPVLPTLPPPRKEERLGAQFKVFVRKFRFIGNTVFSEQALSRITAPYENREIISEELQEVRHKLSLYYVNKGYLNSGVVIPDQEVKEGIIRLQIIEGKLSDIEVSGNTWLRSGYIAKRLALGAGSPLNIYKLQERLLILRQNPLIERINAELGPGVTVGKGILKVKVAEQRPYTLTLAFNNYRSPSIGSKQGEVVAAHSNLTGWGDRLWARYGLTEGVDEVAATYAIPLNAYDTTLGLRFDRSSALVIEEPFSELDITSETETYGVALSQPFYLSPYQTFSIGLALERRHSETFLLGIPFSFSPGVRNGKSDVTVVRFSQEWLSRSLTQLIAARSIFSVGIDALDATVNPSPPDGKFFTWLGQFQWVRRLPHRDSEVLFRSDVQLAGETLLPIEKFPIGGANSVRGYRENQLVRDNGWVSSLEFRVPVFRLPLPWLSERPEEGLVQLVPFADFGWSWNTGSSTPEPEIIYSVGLGIRWDPTRRIHGQLYWGKALKDVDNPDTDLQDEGIHFLVSWQVF